MLYLETSTYRIHWGDVLDCLTEVEPASVRTIVTSPPYFDLRDYGTANWLGGDPACAHGVELGSRAKDSSSTIAGTTKQEASGPVYREKCGRCGAVRSDDQIGIEATLADYVARLVGVFEACRPVLAPDGSLWLNLGDTCRDKQLQGAPWMVALALQEAGWFLRSCIIWDKSNGYPESVHDRPTESHEYVFLLAPQASYYFRHRGEKHVRSVWRGPTAALPGKHTAVMPLWLARRCVLLTSASGDTVLDPFAGTGTTLVAATGYARQAVGIDLLSENCATQVRRIEKELTGSAPARVEVSLSEP